MMTLLDVYRSEIERVYAVEIRIVPTLERMEMKAREFGTRAIFQQKLDAVPARLGRLEMVFALQGWTPREAEPHWLTGWQMEVESWMFREPSDDLGDGMILTYLLKFTRMRTACFEAAFVLATSLGNHEAAKLLGALWREERELDEEIAESLMTAVERSAAVE